MKINANVIKDIADAAAQRAHQTMVDSIVTPVNDPALVREIIAAQIRSALEAFNDAQT